MFSTPPQMPAVFSLATSHHNNYIPRIMEIPDLKCLNHISFTETGLIR